MRSRSHQSYLNGNMIIPHHKSLCPSPLHYSHCSSKLQPFIFPLSPHFLPHSSNFKTEMSEKEKKKLLWPPWLSPLLHTSFFNPCSFHTGLSRNECNMYCIDCANGALCSSCLIQHYNHRIIQIRRSSYHDVIRVAEIQSLVDISGIQTYVINGAKVVFLNERLQPKMGKTVATNTCRNCRRSLLDAFGFCSLGCKLFKTTSSPSSISKPLKLHSGPKKAAINEESKFIFSNISFDCISPTPHETPTIKINRIKRRKGIPRRAPMGVYS